MAKKQPAQPAPPKVSQLPLPISDSPLVIDLPDGQKLVIGKMAEGSVIEVATWRGTGRPDSRTSRLMLGMSPGQLADDASETTGYAANKSEKKGEGIAKYLAIAKNLFKVVLNFISKLPLGKLKKLKLPKIGIGSRKPRTKALQPSAPADLSSSSIPISTPTAPAPAPSSKATKAGDQDDVDDWLAAIIQKAESRSKIEPKVNNLSKSATKVSSAKKKAAVSPKKTTKGKK